VYGLRGNVDHHEGQHVRLTQPQGVTCDTRTGIVYFTDNSSVRVCYPNGN
jgi:hypothetical protein